MPGCRSKEDDQGFPEISGELSLYEAERTGSQRGADRGSKRKEQAPGKVRAQDLDEGKGKGDARWGD